jgi:hypothetical protein
MLNKLYIQKVNTELRQVTWSRTLF